MNKNLDLIYQLSSISNSYYDRMGKMIKHYNEPDGTTLGNFIEIVPLKVNKGLVEEPRPFTSQKNRQLPSKNYKIRARNKTKNVKKNTINNHHIENEDKNNNNIIDDKMNKLLNVTLEIKRSSTAESNRNHIYSNSTNRKYISDLNTIEEVGNINLHNLNKKPTFNKINEEQKNNNIIQSNNICQNKIKTFYNNIKNEKDKLHRINTLQITNSFNKNKPNTNKTNLKDVSLMSSSNYNEFSPKNKTLYMNNNKLLIFDNEISEKLQSLIRGNSVDNNTRNIKKEKEEKKLNTISNKNLKNKKEIPKEEITERIIRIRKNYQEKEKEMFNQNYLFYSILPGNASYLVKNCMCHRTNWREPFSKVTTLFHFKWQEISYGIDYNNLSKVGFKQIVNHFENHYCISNKANLFCNLMKYCEDRKISVFKFVPFTVVYKFKEKKRDKEEDIKIFEKENQYAKDNLKKFINISKNFIVDYNDIGKYYEDENFIKESEKRQFEKEEKKEKKKKKKKKKKKEENENIEKEENEKSNFYCDYFSKLKPNDRIIPTLSLGELTEKEKIERKKEKKKIIGSKTIIEIPKTHETGKNMWLVKAVNLNRGKCIKIVNSFEQIEKVIDKFKQGVGYGFTNQNIEDLEIKVIKENINEEENIKNNNNENIENKNFEQEQKTYLCKKIIIQKYIENPLLYKERKCDIRIWVLLTHKMKVYVFKEGHLKTCSVNYDVNSKNAFSHITNYSFQKYNNNFQKFEKGNEVPFYEFQKFIDEKYPDKKYNLKTNLMEKVKEIIILTMRAGKEKINKNNRNYQFEIFGYDFMLDNDFNVFLIEINTNPGLEESSPWIKIIIPRMLDDALRLTLDQIYEPKYDFNLNYKNINDDINIQKVNDNLKNNIDPNSVINNNIKIFSSIKEEEENKSNIENSIDNENLNVNDKKIENKNQKYISPFPVPGYDLDDNLWNFICDLNEKDPFDERLENEIIENEKKESVSFTGIKHLIKKKKNKQK